LPKQEQEGQIIRETLIANMGEVSKTNSDAECPEHGRVCTLRYAIFDGKKGVYCRKSHKFYPKEDLKGW